MIDRAHDLPITKQAEVLRISRGSVYYRPRPVPETGLAIMRRLDRLHLEYPFADSRMLRGLLAADGCKIGRRHVKTLMQRMGIEALYRRPRTSKPEPGHKVYPCLLRGMAIERPNQVWAMDITFIPMARGGLVTPLRDGMNLVAKEYVAAQDPDDPGVLILSRFTGAAVELRSALLVNPYDAESVANALLQALAMPLEERRARHKALRAKVCEYDVNRWQREFLTALRRGREYERFQGYASNAELTNLETSGARLAPIESAESRELEREDR